MRITLGRLRCWASWIASTFQYAPSVASTLPDSIAGIRLNPTLTSLTLDGFTPARARIAFRYADWYGMPAVPTVLPASCLGSEIARRPIDTTEVSGFWTSAPTATSL